MSSFKFTFEVWHVVSPSKDHLVGFCQISLTQLAHILTANGPGLNTSYFSEGNIYPVVGHDGLIQIKTMMGDNVGWLKATLAMGTSSQINKFVAQEDERD